MTIITKKILIVEDEELLADLLRRKLIKENYQVSIARNGEEGLRMMREIMPDLILMDIVMPKVNGFEVLEEMAKEPHLKKIPVIVISNSGQEAELDKARTLGAKDCLVKTEFSPREVINKVVEQIGK